MLSKTLDSRWTISHPALLEALESETTFPKSDSWLFCNCGFAEWQLRSSMIVLWMHRLGQTRSIPRRDHIGVGYQRPPAIFLSEAMDLSTPPFLTVIDASCDNAEQVGFPATISKASTSALPPVDQANVVKSSVQHDRVLLEDLPQAVTLVACMVEKE